MDRPSTSFNFLALPREIRNMIYNYLLKTYDNNCNLTIDHLHPIAYDYLTSRGKAIYRTPFRCLITQDAERVPPYEVTNGDWTSMQSTIYAAAKNRNSSNSPISTTFGLVAANRQIRSELLGPVYSTTTFTFVDEFAVIPFLNDRTQLSRDWIRSLRLTLTLIDDGHHHERQAQWIANFKYLAKSLHLTHLSLLILDHDAILLEPDALEDPYLSSWLSALAGIEGLRELNVVIDYPLYDEDVVDEAVLETIEMGIENWNPKHWMREYLEPLMGLTGRVCSVDEDWALEGRIRWTSVAP